MQQRADFRAAQFFRPKLTKIVEWELDALLALELEDLELLLQSLRMT